MKIFTLITKSEQGGAQTHVAQIARYCIEQGHKMAVMSTPGGWLEGEVVRLGGTFYPNTSLGNTLSPTRLLQAHRELQKALDDFSPDVVACHSTMAGLLGRFTILNRIPTIFTAHGWSFTQGAPWQRRLLVPLIEKLAGLFCTRIICVSKNDAQLARTFHIAPTEKITIIYNGVELPPPTTKDTDNHSLVQVFFVGRLADPKDPCLLLEALHNLPQTEKDRVHLTLIGDGPQRPLVESQLKKFALTQYVTLTGSLPRERVLEHLTTADIFVLPTRWEGFPYTILEAMSFDIPVIASDVGGIKEAVTKDTGLLIPPNSLPTLTQALSALINDSEKRAQMGSAGRARVQDLFSVKEMCQKTIHVYEQATNVFPNA